MKNLPVINLAVILSAISTISHGALVSYSFNGNLNQGLPDPRNPGANTDVYPVNVPFIGTFSYDDSFAPIGGTGTSATYDLLEFTMQINPGMIFPGVPDESFAIGGGTIDVFDNEPTVGDRLRINAGANLTPVTVGLNGFTLDVDQIRLTYDDSTGGLFTSFDLPGADLTEGSFDSAGIIDFDFSIDGAFGAQEGDLDNLRSIPEPSSILLLLGGLSSGLLVRRRH